MDSNHHHHHQEVDLSEEDDNSLGIGRSYDCVFCKRGFNTAQALGGHMNIHRKDRARNNKPPAKHENHQIPSYQQPDLASQFNVTSYFPAPASPAQQNHLYYMNINDLNPQRFNPFGVDHSSSMSLDLPFGPSAHVEDIEKNRRIGGQDEELDLELRLGP